MKHAKLEQIAAEAMAHPAVDSAMTPPGLNGRTFVDSYSLTITRRLDYRRWLVEVRCTMAERSWSDSLVVSDFVLANDTSLPSTLQLRIAEMWVGIFAIAYRVFQESKR